MAKNCLFVKAPGTPFRFDDFQPDVTLLELACDALQVYDQVAVEDLGRVETFEHLYPQETVHETLRWATGLSGEETLAYVHDDGAPIEKRMPASVRRRHMQVYDQIAERIIGPHRPESIVFKVDHGKDLLPTLRMAQRIRALRPTIRLMGFGRGIGSSEDIALEALKVLDCIRPSERGNALLELHDRPLKRTWPEVAGIAYHDGVRLVFTPESQEMDGRLAGLHAMEKILYNMGEEFSILRVLELDAVDGETGSSSMRPLRDVGRGAASDAMDAVRKLATAFGTAAFSFRTGSGISALAQALLKNRVGIAYAADVDPDHALADRLGVLAASGCVAANVQLQTGSRRLLDTYYHRRFSLIDTEAMLRSARHSGVFMSSQFIYPSAEDDHHTADETLRFIKRSQSASACFLLERDPGSAWSRGWFRTRPREVKREEMERRRMGSSVRRLGISAGISARQALLARLAGFQDREEEFCRLTALQVLTGDATGVAETLARINDHARRKAGRARIKPFAIDSSIAAN